VTLSFTPRSYLELDTRDLQAKLHLPLDVFHEGDLVDFWSVTKAAWVPDACIEAEHPITGHLQIAYDFPTDAAGRRTAIAQIKRLAEKIRLLQEEEVFDAQLDATSKGSKDKEISALFAQIEHQQKVLQPLSRAVIPKQDQVGLWGLKVELWDCGWLAGVHVQL
jgi:hypothetical protein